MNFLRRQPAPKRLQSSQIHRLLTAFLFLASLALRLAAVSVPITTDEAKWLERGLAFGKHLISGTWADTYQWHHPGVPLMWLNAAGGGLHWGLGRLGVLPEVSPSLMQYWDSFPLQTDLPLSLYCVSRVLQAVVTSIGMVLLFDQARRLLGGAIALVGIVILSLEPFFLGYQRLLLTDVLQTQCLTLSVLLLLRALAGTGRRRALLGSGVALGLAASTKITTLSVLPAIALWLVCIERGQWRPQFLPQGWRSQRKTLTTWLGTALMTGFAIWPALWVSPLGTINQLIEGLKEETERGEFFYWGQTVDSIGASFYPVVLLYRLTPLLLLGLSVALVGLVGLTVPRLRQRLPQVPAQVPALVALLLVAVCMLAVLSLSDNKLDRYILPTIPALAWLAAAGWLQLWEWLRIWRRRRQGGKLTSLASGAIALLVVLHLVALGHHAPYFLTYFNPLLGGPKAAQQVLMVGNGEGLDQAAVWLNRQENAAALTVGSWYPAAFAPYFQGKTVGIRRSLEADHLVLDYLVLYVNQLQRQLPSAQALRGVMRDPPLHVVWLHGVEYIRIYPGLDPQASRDFRSEPVRKLDFAGRS
ncbi:MAG: glycosyltransferase family 39 protein, partial [Cyanobacteriota bacterium]